MIDSLIEFDIEIRKAADMGDELGKELLPDIEYFANN